MIVFNTTYCIDKKINAELIRYLKESYIPSVLASNVFNNARLCRVLGADEEEGESYSLQFDVDSAEALEGWYAANGSTLHNALLEHFGQQVAAFATLLHPIETE